MSKQITFCGQNFAFLASYQRWPRMGNTGGAMLLSAKETGRALRINPEVLQGIAPLPDVDEVQLVIEPPPAPKNRVRFKLKNPFVSESEVFGITAAEGLFGITAFALVLMVFAVALVVLERT
jgi:hypothetical protein